MTATLALTTEQRRALPHWLRSFPCNDEYGNYPLTLEQWTHLVCQHLRIPLPAKPPKQVQSSVTEHLLNEILARYALALEHLPKGAAADHIAQHAKVVEGVLAGLHKANLARVANAAKARMAQAAKQGHIGSKATVRLLVTNPNGDSVEVMGWDAAARVVPGATAQGLSIRMSQAIRKTHRPIAMIGRKNRPEELWSIKKLA